MQYYTLKNRRALQIVRSLCLVVGLLGFALSSLFAQINAGKDSLFKNRILTLRDFYQMIITHHPIVRQANLLGELARMEIRMSRGFFDPKVTSDFIRKEFDNKDYFNIWNSYVKVPFWIGDLKVGYERGVGDFVNPENFTAPQQGYGVLGISVPLARDLIMDERRSVLMKAQLFQNIAEAERVKEINKVLLSAAKDYWEWYFRYHQYLLLQTGFDLARIRYEAVKQRVGMGELAAIDSVEAKITLQDRSIQLRLGRIEFINAGIILSNYLWDKNDIPLELASDVVPESFNLNARVIGTAELEKYFEFAKNSHPELVKMRFKLRQLDVDERLQRNNFLPKAEVNYNFLPVIRNNTESNGSLMYSNTLGGSYKFGFTFEFPLFLRKERGKFQQIQIKQLQTNFELTQTNREINNQIQTAYNEIKTYEQLLGEQQSMVNNYQTLRDAELRKFQNGESSLFLINTRESKLIESQVKLEELKSKYEKARAMLIWASGGSLWE